MPKRKDKTAEELMNELESDPAWVAKRDARLARYRERESRLRDDQSSLIEELAAVGVQCESVYDFVNRGITPVEAFPVLVAHLDQAHLPNNREGIIRALTQRDARLFAFEALVHHYKHEKEPHLQWAIANALSAMARYEEVCDLERISEYRKLFPGTA